MAGKSLERGQVAAIEHNVSLARRIQKEYGVGLRSDRLGLMTYEQIGKKYNYFVEVGVEPKNISSVLYHVFRGHRNGEGSFEGLLSESEAEAVRVATIKRAIKNDETRYERTLGAFNAGKRSEVASKAGHAAYIKLVGIHSPDYEMPDYVKKKAVRKSLKSRGFNPWTDGESLMIHFLRESDVYSWPEIVEAVNGSWGNNRSEKSVRVQASRFKSRYGSLRDRLFS